MSKLKEDGIVGKVKVRRLCRTPEYQNTYSYRHAVYKKYNDMYNQEERDIDKTVESIKKYAR